MAEGIDVLIALSGHFDAAASNSSDTKSDKDGKKRIDFVNLCCLTLGKVGDIAADWVIVFQVFAVVAMVPGCVNTCEYARNFVCQDGIDVLDTVAEMAQTCTGTIASGVCGGHNISILPASCDYGTDCDDCGPRTPLAPTEEYSDSLKLIALLIAVAGTSVELLAAGLKIALSQGHTLELVEVTRFCGFAIQLPTGKLVQNEKFGATFYTVHSANLSRKMAVPRFLLDDLPATVLALYILLSFPNKFSLSTLVLLLASVLYSVYAMIYHICKTLAGSGASMYQELKEEQVSMASVKEMGLTAEELKSGGASLEDLVGAFRASELREAGYDMRSLSSVTIPSSVTQIGGYAFNGCSSLSSVTIPSSVTQIGGYAFNGCSSLSSVTIPSSVTQIGGYAFERCSSLSSVTIPSSVTQIGDGAFARCSSLSSVTIPSSVTQIGGYAFNGCSSLSSVTIPSSVTQIGDYAFARCSSLSSVTIPSSVTQIGDGAFLNCSSLSSVTIPSSVKLGENAFSSKTTVTRADASLAA